MAGTREIRMGAMSPSLVTQGVHDPAGHLQADAEAITRLLVRGLLTKREADTARRRLIRTFPGEVTT